MGALFAKKKKPPSRVTDHDRAVLQLKQQRDRLKQYQKRIELSLENDRQLAKKCLQTGRKDRAKLLLRKKKYQENLLANTDQQLENLEKLTNDLEFAQVELQVLEGLKQGNAALKKVHAILDINEIEMIMDETREGVEKQQEIDALLSNVLTSEDENDVLAELDELISAEVTSKLPDVPFNELPEDVAEKEENEVEKYGDVERDESRKTKTKNDIRGKSRAVLVES